MEELTLRDIGKQLEQIKNLLKKYLKHNEKGFDTTSHTAKEIWWIFHESTNEGESQILELVEPKGEANDTA